MSCFLHAITGLTKLTYTFVVITYIVHHVLWLMWSYDESDNTIPFTIFFSTNIYPDKSIYYVILPPYLVFTSQGRPQRLPLIECCEYCLRIPLPVTVRFPKYDNNGLPTSTKASAYVPHSRCWIQYSTKY